METKKFEIFSNKFEIEFDLYFDLCQRADINIQVGLNMHLFDDTGDASSSLRGSTSSFIKLFIAEHSTFERCTFIFLEYAQMNSTNSSYCHLGQLML